MFETTAARSTLLKTVLAFLSLSFCAACGPEALGTATETMASATKVLLTGGAQAKNVFWQVAGYVELGTTAHCEGIVLTKTAVMMLPGSSITGRLLAQTAVTLDHSTVVQP